MKIKNAKILLALIFVGVIAILSLAAYTVKNQNNENIQAAVPTTTASPQNSALVPVSLPDNTPITNDAVNTDKNSVIYKTIASKTFTFEVPFAYNSIDEAINGCEAKNIVNNTISITISPQNCTIPGTFSVTTQKDGYTIAGNFPDQDIVTKGVYKHILDTFTLLQ